MKIILIAAVDKNGCIGKNNKMSWHITKDLEFFRQKTYDHIVIMGKNTFGSLHNKPLPSRLNIVMSTSLSFFTTGVRVARDRTQAMSIAARAILRENYTDEVYVIGGEEIYKQFMDLAEIIYISRVAENFIVADGDAFFPKIDAEKWEKIDSCQPGLFTPEFYVERFDRK